jgi:hypothetical protein
MRTTITLDDDASRVARLYAAGYSITLGEAVSELVRRGLAFQRPVSLHAFDLPADRPPTSHNKAGPETRGRGTIGVLLEMSVRIALVWPVGEPCIFL